MTADTITEGENATEMEHAESDIDDDSDPDYSRDDSFHESEEEGDSGDKWETNNCSQEVTDNPMDEKYYLVSESALCELLFLCRVCDSQCIPVIEYSKGTMICTSSVCGNGHVSKWQSVMPQQTSMGESSTLKCNYAKWKSYLKRTSSVGPYESKKSQCMNRFQTTIGIYRSCHN